jgi:hypothetical protein
LSLAPERSLIDPLARVVVATADGTITSLQSGDLVGRGHACKLVLDDPRISEAHALVSLRGDALWLLGLRGRMHVAGAAIDRLRLDEDTVVTLAPGVTLTVLEVVVPDAVMAVELGGLGAQLLSGTTSVVTRPVPVLRGGWHPAADAWIWNTDDTWRLRRAGERELVLLEDGVAITVAGVDLVPRWAAVDDAGIAHTLKSAEPLRIEAKFYSVHITRRSGGEALVVNGTAARVLSELVALKGPVEWSVAAREIWGQDAPEVLLRSRWDTTISRLRHRLRCAGLRPDLVRASRSGIVELVLGPEDEVIDLT